MKPIFVCRLLARSIGLLNFISLAGIVHGEPVAKKLILPISEDEYETEPALPEFAVKHLNDYRVVVVPTGREGANSVFDKTEEVEDTDVLLVSVHRRLPPQWQTKQRLEPQNPSGGLRSPAASPCSQP